MKLPITIPQITYKIRLKIITKVPIEIPIFIDVPELTSNYLIQSFDDNIERIYTIPVGSKTYDILGDSTIKWRDGMPPKVRENHTYIVSVIGIYAVYGEF